MLLKLLVAIEAYVAGSAAILSCFQLIRLE